MHLCLYVHVYVNVYITAFMNIIGHKNKFYKVLYNIHIFINILK